MKSIVEYDSLRSVVRELGVDASIAAILRSADQDAFDEVRPLGCSWGAGRSGGIEPRGCEQGIPIVRLPETKEREGTT